MTTTLLSIFAAALAISAICTGAIVAACRRAGLHEPDAPPRLGGPAIALGFMLPMACVAHMLPVSWSPLAGAAMLALALLAMGVYDDLRGLPAAKKLAVQLLIAGATWSLGLRIEALSTPWGRLLLDPWVSFGFTVAWIVLLTNAVNLIDGLDGLAAGVSLIAVVTLLALGVRDGQPLLWVVGAALAGALVGFLLFNFNPAAIFMGDSGSQFLGYVLAVASIASTSKQYTTWAVLPAVLAVGLPIADTGLAVMRRLGTGQPVMGADAGHVHHRLLRAGYSQRQAVLLLYAVSCLLGLVAWTLELDTARALIIAAAGAASIGLMHRLAFHQPDTRVWGDPVQRRAFTRAIRGSRDEDELWLTILEALVTLNVLSARLELHTASAPRWEYRGVKPAIVGRSLEMKLPLSGARHEYGQLVVERQRHSNPRQEWQRELQIHLVAEAACDALDALAPRLARKLVVHRFPSS